MIYESDNKNPIRLLSLRKRNRRKKKLCVSPGSIDAGGSDGSSLRPGGGRRGTIRGSRGPAAGEQGQLAASAPPPPHNLSLPASALKPPPTSHYTPLSLTRCLPPFPPPMVSTMPPASGDSAAAQESFLCWQGDQELPGVGEQESSAGGCRAPSPRKMWSIGWD